MLRIFVEGLDVAHAKSRHLKRRTENAGNNSEIAQSRVKMDIIHVTACETRRDHNSSRVIHIDHKYEYSKPHRIRSEKHTRKRESISRRRRQKGQVGNLVLSRHAHALVVMVAVGALAVSGDLTLHETLLQAERYA